jgi:DNA-binding transcriptional MerR regulator
MGKVQDMPGERVVFRPRSRPISLNTFQFEVKQYIKTLKEKEVAIANAHKLFAGERKIWPDQCERILPPLSEIEKPMQELSTLLRDPYHPPDHHRRFLLRSLQSIDEQIQALIPLSTNFCITCQTSPRQVPKQRRAIEQRLETIST